MFEFWGFFFFRGSGFLYNYKLKFVVKEEGWAEVAERDKYLYDGGRGEICNAPVAMNDQEKTDKMCIKQKEICHPSFYSVIQYVSGPFILQYTETLHIYWS